MLKVLFVLCVLIFAMKVQAQSVYDQAADQFAPMRKAAKEKLCDSTDAYIKTLKFLRESKDFHFNEEAARKIAAQVSKGCTGAAERFSQVLVLLKTVGLSEKKSLEVALEFVFSTPDVQKNFVEIFSKSFLAEFFDYEFPKAMKLALELSKGYEGDPAILREDFISMIKYCKDKKGLDLPLSQCANYAVIVAKLSQYHDKGIATDFVSLYETLRFKKDFNFDVKKAMELTPRILQNGPKAKDNFFSAYEFALKDLEYDRRQAVLFALELADRSFVGEKPPLLQFTSKSL
jgi:hypothetical protein